MSNEKNIELTAMIIDQMLTRSLMQALPDEWHKSGEDDSPAINVAIPMPKKAIKALESCKETLSDDRLKDLINFNDILSVYLSELVFRGLSAKVEELEKGTDVVFDRLRKLITTEGGDLR